MRVLVLGGTQFVGRAMVSAAISAGHDVTIFNRGRTAADLFAGDVTVVRGDREQADDLAALDATWDIVIDACGYVPRIVQLSVDHLRERAGRYVFISTGSVYQHPIPIGADEEAPQLDEAAATTDDPSTFYGELKVGCERVVVEAFAEAATIIRPGIVAGAHDPTDRATWWIRMAMTSPSLIVPDDPEAWTQLIDARDLADFTLHAAQHNLTGPYNLVGPAINLADWAELVVAVTGSGSELVRVSPESLVDAGVRPSTDIPLWLLAKDGSFKRRSHARAATDGLHPRAVADTIRDIMQWDASRSGALDVGLSAKELTALAARLS